MQRKNTTLDLHAKLAHEIKSAKRTMFKRHREGVPLRAAADQFVIDITNRFHSVVPDHEPPTDLAGVLEQDNREHAILEQVRAETEATPTPKTEVFDEVQEQAMRAIMALLDARAIPTCIKRGLADALEETAKIAGVNHRTIWTTNPGPGLNLNSKVLWEVFETPTVQEMWDLPRKRDVLTETDEQRVKAEAKQVADFLESGAPDFLTEQMIAALDDAFDHFGLPRPVCEMGQGDYDAENLKPLFQKTKLFNLNDIEQNTVANLSWAIAHVLNSPITPARLKQKVGEFVTDISSPIFDDSQEIVEQALGFGQCGYAGCPGSDDPLKPCPGPDTSGAHVGEQEHDKHDDESVTATLPDGEKVELYGDAVDLAKAKPVNGKVLRAMSELLHNPETPGDLYESVAEFVCEATSSITEDVLHSDDSLARMLNGLSPDETMGAIRAAARASEN